MTAQSVRKKSAAKNTSPPQIGEMIGRRRTEFLPDGAYFFEDRLETAQEIVTAKIVTGAAWLLEFIELQTGEIFFHVGGEKVFIKAKAIGIFYAPFSLLEFGYKNAKGRVCGIASIVSLPAEIAASKPFVFVSPAASTAKMPENATEAIEILQARRNFQFVGFNPKASLLSLKTKKLIDENRLAFPSISRIAARLKVSHEHLSRQFKRDFGMTPSAYLHKLRIADAQLRLAQGEEIIEISQEVGYNDLSRFYKQFRKATKTSPGACQSLVKPEEI